MTTGTALVLLGFGVGALIGAGQAAPREPQSPRARADALRERAAFAQQSSARASHHARELTAMWSDAENAARREVR